MADVTSAAAAQTATSAETAAAPLVSSKPFAEAASKSGAELTAVSLAFLEGPPPVAKAADGKGADAETGRQGDGETSEMEDPGEVSLDDEAETEASEESEETETTETTEEQEAAAETEQAQQPRAPKWLGQLLAALPEGAMPKWAPKRIVELVDKALGKNATLREKEARIAELEEERSALRAKESAALPENDARGRLKSVTDKETLKQHSASAQGWIDWCASVEPDDAGTVPNPDQPNGEPWDLAKVRARLKLAMGSKQAAEAQMNYLRDYEATHGEVRKQFPALFDPKSEERQIAQRYLDKMPWLDQQGDKEAILARLVLGEQALQKRAKGVQTVELRRAASPNKTTTTKTTNGATEDGSVTVRKAAPRVGALPQARVTVQGAAPNLDELRKRQANGDRQAAAQIARLALED